MGKVVEDDVVRMQFENGQFEKKIRQSQKSIEALKKSIDFSESGKSLAKFQNETKKFNMDGMGRAVEAVQVKFSAMDTVAMSVLNRLTNAAVDAGKKIVSALAFDGMSDGWNEYKLKMNSIQTIIMSTGESLSTVNKYLDELNTYSDRTIYSFSDMTANIGKFTNAGVGLKDAVAAIKGVSNEAAISGANAEQASHAMYNFAQALSSGYVKLIDWKSIEVANMATMDFKQNLLDTAVALGTVVKKGEDYYTTTTNAKGATSDAFNATKNWNDNLQYQWMTTDVLVKTLSKYTDETTELGQKAYAAASEFKDAGQMFTAWKEAIGSGWEHMWETIFGNFEESKKLWGFLDSIIGNYIVKTFAAKNATLDAWKKMGGRNSLMHSFTNILAAAVAVLDTFKVAYRAIFPEKNAKEIKNITDAFEAFTKKLIMSRDKVDKLYRTLKGFFTIIKIMTNLIGNGLNVALAIASKLFPAIADGLLTITASAGDAISKSGDAIDRVTNKITNFVKLVGQKIALPGFEGVVSILKGIWKIITIVGGKVTSFFKMLGSGMSNAFRSGDIKSALDILNTGLISGMLIGLNKFVAQFNSFFKDAKKTVDGITKILDPVRECFEAFQSKLRADALIKIASAIGILAVSLMLIASIKPDRLASALLGISGLFSELMLSLAAFSKISGSMKGVAKSCAAMISISAAVLILSSAMKKLSSIDLSGIGRGLTAVGGLLAELLAFQAISKKIDKVGKASKGIVSISLAMLILSQAVKNFGNLSWEQIGKGLASVAALLVSIAAFTALTGNAKKIISTSTAMISLSIAMNLLAVATNRFSGMSWTGIAKGLTAMGAALVELSVAMNFMPKGMIAKGAGLIAVVTALNILTSALSSSGNMEWTEIAKGLIAIGGSLSILAIALNAMKGTISGSIALTTAAGALAILTPQLLLLGNMSVSSIAKSLLTLAGAFTVIGVAGAALVPILPAILGMAGAFALIGVSVLGIGTGLLAAGVGLTAIAAGFTALAGTTAAGATAIVASLSVIITGIAGLIPAIASKIGEGIVEFCKAIANGASAIGNMVKTVLLTVLDVINTCAPDIVETVVGLIDALLTTISQHMPNIVNAGMDILEAFISGIADHISDITESAIDIVINFVNAISDKLPDVIDAGFNLIISFINGLADAIDKNTPKLTKAVNKLMIAVLDAAVTVLTGGIDLFKTIGNKIMNSGLVKGIKSKTSTMVKTIKDSISSGIKSAKSFGSKWLSVGKNFVSGVIKGIKDKAAGLAKAAADVGKEALNGIKKALDIHSPSKETNKLGVYAGEGLVKGVKSKTGDVELAGIDMGRGALLGAGKGIKDGAKKAQKTVTGYVKGIKKSISKSVGNKDVDGVMKTVNGILNAGNSTFSDQMDKTTKDIIKNANKTGAGVTSAYDSTSKKITGRSKKNSKKAKIKMTKIIKVAYQFGKTFDKAVSSFNKTPYETITKISKSLGKELLKTTPKLKTVSKATKTAEKTIKNFAIALYKESDQYKEDTKSVNQHEAALKKLLKTQDRLKKGLSASGKKLSKKNLNSAIKENNTAIKNAVKQLKDDQKTIQSNINSTFKEYRNNIINSIKEYTKFTNIAFDNSRNIFSEFSDSMDDEMSTVLKNMESQVDGYQEMKDNLAKLSKNGLSKGLIDTLKGMGESGYAYIKLFANASKEEIDRANAAYAEASKQSKEDIIASYKKTYQDAVKWKNSIKKMLNQGWDIRLVQELVDEGPGNLSKVLEMLTFSDEERKEINSVYVKNLKLQKSGANDIIKSFALKKEKEAAKKKAKKNVKKTAKDVKKDVKEIPNAVSEAAKEMEKNLKKINGDWDDAKKKIEDTAKSMAESVKSSLDSFTSFVNFDISSSTDYFTRYEEVVNDLGNDTIIDRMWSQVNAEKRVIEGLEELKNMGFADGLLDYLKSLGTQAIPYIEGFRLATADQIGRTNAVFKEKMQMTKDQILQQAKDNMESVKKWRDEIVVLSKELDPRLLQELINKGLDGADIVDAYFQMTPDEKKQINQYYKDTLSMNEEVSKEVSDSYKEAGLGAVNSMYQGMIDAATGKDVSSKKGSSRNLKGSAATKTVHAVAKSFDEVLKKDTSFKSSGKKAGNQFKAGIDSASEGVANSAKQSAKKACTTFTNYVETNFKKAFKSAGESMGTRFAIGLSSSSVLSTVESSCKAVVDKALSEFGKGSGKAGSKGTSLGTSFANGIKGAIPSAVSAAQALVDAVNAVLSTIRMPTLTASISTSGLSSLGTNSAIISGAVTSATGSSAAGTSAGLAASIASSLAGGVMGSNLKKALAALQNGGRGKTGHALKGSSTNVTNNYTFNQTNNSPVALSNTEIYRQTKNQFSQLKGALK